MVMKFNDVFYVLKQYRKASQVQQAIREALEAVNICALSRADYGKALQAEWDDLEDCLIALPPIELIPTT